MSIIQEPWKKEISIMLVVFGTCGQSFKKGWYFQAVELYAHFVLLNTSLLAFVVLFFLDHNVIVSYYMAWEQ